MQQSTLSAIIREEVIRAFTFGSILFIIIMAIITGVANAANGGIFGEVMNLMLTGNRAGIAGRTWDNPGDGTVNNATKLGNNPSTAYQKVALPNQSCALNQCIYGFDPSGNILCR